MIKKLGFILWSVVCRFVCLFKEHASFSVKSFIQGPKYKTQRRNSSFEVEGRTFGAQLAQPLGLPTDHLKARLQDDGGDTYEQK